MCGAVAWAKVMRVVGGWGGKGLKCVAGWGVGFVVGKVGGHRGGTNVVRFSNGVGVGLAR